MNHNNSTLAQLFPFACAVVQCQGAPYEVILRAKPQESLDANTLHPAKVLIYADHPLEGLWVYHNESKQFYGLSKRHQEHLLCGPSYYAYNGYLGRLVNAFYEKVGSDDHGLNLLPKEMGDVFIFNGEMARRNGEEVERRMEIMSPIIMAVGDKVTINKNRFTVTQVQYDLCKQVITIEL